jgi:hypothetical protein
MKDVCNIKNGNLSEIGTPGIASDNGYIEVPKLVLLHDLHDCKKVSFTTLNMTEIAMDIPHKPS